MSHSCLVQKMVIRASGLSPSKFQMTPDRLLQRSCACGGICSSAGKYEEDHHKDASLQRSAAAPVRAKRIPGIVHDVLRSPGQPLDHSVRAFAEPRFNHDFSKVRIHTDSMAAASAEKVNALAYTVGDHVVFARGQYSTESHEGRRLISHELTHTIQQQGAQHGPTHIGPSDDQYEREADTMSQRVVAGDNVVGSPASSDTRLQREDPETPDFAAPAKKPEDPITDGLKTVGTQAKDNNPQVKKLILDPLKDLALKTFWANRSGGEKAAEISVGATATGLALGAFLSSREGRSYLNGLNVGAPLSLIPYMPLQSFKYELPGTDANKSQLFYFQTGFKGDDYLKLLTKGTFLKDLSLEVNLNWTYNPATDHLGIDAAAAKLGILPGVTLTGGVGLKQTDPLKVAPGAEGSIVESRKSIPGVNDDKGIPDARIMLTVDLLKVIPKLKNIF